MVTFTGISLKNEHYEVHAGDKKSFVLEALGIDPGKLISLNANASYKTLEKVSMAELTGECDLLFVGDELIKISFIPTLREYISEYMREFGELTRNGLYVCVKKGYHHINDYLDKEDWISCSSGSMKTTYQSKNHIVHVGIDRDKESLGVETEALT